MKCPFCIKVCTKCKRILVAWKGNFVKKKGGKYGLRANCKECRKCYDKETNQREKSKQRYKNNRENISKKRKEKYNNDEEYRNNILEKNKQWYKDNPSKAFNSHNQRRQKLENQGNGVTNEQLHEMYIFFNGECAYSGIKLKRGINNSIDHIIALDNEGLNEIWNIVPMHKPYNSSKWKNDMEQWYRQQEYFSEERLEKIYEWCEYAWNKWGYK